METLFDHPKNTYAPQAVVAANDAEELAKRIAALETDVDKTRQEAKEVAQAAVEAKEVIRRLMAVLNGGTAAGAGGKKQ